MGHHCSRLPTCLPALPFTYFELVLTFFDEKRCTQKRVISWPVLLSFSSCPHWSLESSPPLSMLQGHQSQDFCHCLDQMHDSQMDFRINSSSEQGGTSTVSLAASPLAQGSFGQSEVTREGGRKFCQTLAHSRRPNARLKGQGAHLDQGPKPRRRDLPKHL